MSTMEYAPPAGPFTERLWKAASEVVAKTEQHPFVTGLLDGTLPLESFQFYIRQDGLYLKDFGRGLAMLVSKSHHDAQAEHLLSSSRATMLVEAAMHEKWMSEWGKNNPFAANPKAPQTELYTSWLMRLAAVGGFKTAMAAFAPCFWVYMHIGKYLLAKREAQGKPSPVECYDQWINQYAGEEFEKSVREMLRLVEELGQHASPTTQQQMEDAFVKGCRMEWMFWDMGLNKADWPV